MRVYEPSRKIPRREPKRGCCAHASSPVDKQEQDRRYQTPSRKTRENCELSKCKYSKLDAETTFCNTQKLLDKIQKLKKSIQDLETSQSRTKEDSFRRKDVPSQTHDLTVTDLDSARQVLNNCVKEMTKLKNFLGDENCWWKMFKKMDFTCCEQTEPHLHGHLDGTMVTLKLLEDAKNIVSSTPRSSAEVITDNKVDQESRPKYRINRVLQYSDTYEDSRKYRSPPKVDPSPSTQFVSLASNDSCQGQCPATCSPENNAPTETRTEQDDDEIHQSLTGTYRPLEQRHSSSIKLPRDSQVGRNSIDIAKASKRTFSSENAPNRRIVAVDMGTSVDFVQDSPSDVMAASTRGVKSFMMRTFAPKQNKTFQRSPRSKNREIDIDDLDVNQ